MQQKERLLKEIAARQERDRSNLEKLAQKQALLQEQMDGVTARKQEQREHQQQRQPQPPPPRRPQPPPPRQPPPQPQQPQLPRQPQPQDAYGGSHEAAAVQIQQAARRRTQRVSDERNEASRTIQSRVRRRSAARRQQAEDPGSGAGAGAGAAGAVAQGSKEGDGGEVRSATFLTTNT